MRYTKLLPLIGAIMTIFIASCDDDDDDKFTKTDPRIKVMSVDGVSKTFIINDVEQIIYNYDSLKYGTDITSLSASFYGYDVNYILLGQ